MIGQHNSFQLQNNYNVNKRGFAARSSQKPNNNNILNLTGVGTMKRKNSNQLYNS